MCPQVVEQLPLTEKKKEAEVESVSSFCFALLCSALSRPCPKFIVSQAPRAWPPSRMNVTTTTHPGVWHDLVPKKNETTFAKLEAMRNPFSPE